MRAKISTGRRVVSGLAGLAALITGCVSAPKIADQPEPKPKGSVFFEETVIDGTFYHFVGLMKEGKPYARLLHTDNEDDETQFVTRGDVRLGGFKGTADIVGLANEKNDSGIGLNARGSIAGTDVGVALEKKVSGGEATDMSTIYVRGKTDNTEVTAGLSDVNGDARGILAATYKRGQGIIGAGVNVNRKGEGSKTAVIGRFPENKGEGFGYRAFILDSNGVKVAKVVAGTKSNLSKWTIYGIVSPDGGCLDPRLFRNWFDPYCYLWERTSPGGFVVEGRHTDVFGNQTTEVETIYQLPEIRGISPRVGVCYFRTDDGRDKIGGRVGASFKQGYVDVIFSGSDSILIGGLEAKF